MSTPKSKHQLAMEHAIKAAKDAKNKGLNEQEQIIMAIAEYTAYMENRR